MKFFLLLLVISFSNVWAEIGMVTKVIGAKDAYVIRANEKFSISENFQLMEGDEVFTEDSLLSIHLYPTTQISLNKHGQMLISKNQIDDDGTQEVHRSLIQLLKGEIRARVSKDEGQKIDQRFEATGVAFGVRGTEFEVSDTGSHVELDVVEGEIEVSSRNSHKPFSEKVKANEGMKYSKSEMSVARRPFKEKFQYHPGFLHKDHIISKWREERTKRRLLNKNLQKNRPTMSSTKLNITKSPSPEQPSIQREEIRHERREMIKEKRQEIRKIKAEKEIENKKRKNKKSLKVEEAKK